jgi:deazaflavin-dependent oxidoreductase (nitroreductase family)
MIDFRRLPKFLWRLTKLPGVLYSLGLGSLVGRLVLILTTTGRKSGLPRSTPLQYEEQDGLIYVASARGQRADWFRNVVADPRVEVQVGARRFHGLAEPITDPARIADFMELRLRRHPRMLGAMLRGEGLPARPDRSQLEQFAAKIAMVAIRPVNSL